MIWNDFIECYCELYKVDLNPLLNGKRLGGERLIEMKILSFILRLYFNLTYEYLSELLGLHRPSSQKFYQEVLKTPFYRNEAERWYKECLARLNEQMKQSG